MLGRWNVRLSSLGLYIWDYFYNMTTKLSPLTDIERVSPFSSTFVLALVLINRHYTPAQLSPHVIRILGQASHVLVNLESRGPMIAPSRRTPVR